MAHFPSKLIAAIQPNATFRWQSIWQATCRVYASHIWHRHYAKLRADDLRTQNIQTYLRVYKDVPPTPLNRFFFNSTIQIHIFIIWTKSTSITPTSKNHPFSLPISALTPKCLQTTRWRRGAPLRSNRPKYVIHSLPVHFDQLTMILPMHTPLTNNSGNGR